LFATPGRGNVRRVCAGIAQLVEQLICNQQVVGSNPTAGSLVDRWFYEIAESLAWTLLLFRGHGFAVARRKPDMFYVNHYLKLIEDDLFSKKGLSIRG
jgi:hypothetical protein